MQQLLLMGKLIRKDPNENLSEKEKVQVHHSQFCRSTASQVPHDIPEIPDNYRLNRGLDIYLRAASGWLIYQSPHEVFRALVRVSLLALDLS